MSTFHKNYFLTHRLRAHLLQSDVAYLMGFRSARTIRKVEHRLATPNVQMVMSCESIFGVPASNIFPGETECIVQQVESRARELYAELLGSDVRPPDPYRLEHLKKLSRIATSFKEV